MAVMALLLSGAVFACVVSDALTGPKNADVVLHFTGDSILVVGDTVIFGLVAEVAGEPVAARFRYSIEDSSVVGRAALGDALIGRRRGRTFLRASLASPLLSNPPSLTVTLAVIVGSVTLAPRADTLTSLGDTVAFSAAAFDAHGAPIPGVSPLWASTDTTVADFIAPGRLVARRNGQVAVQAIVDNDTATGSVLVVQRLAGLRLSPSTMPLPRFPVPRSFKSGSSAAIGFGLASRPPVTMVPAPFRTKTIDMVLSLASVSCSIVQP